MNELDLSLVVPVFNEEESLRALYQEIRTALDPTGWNWEVLFCDDGSRDGSLAVLRDLAQEDPRVKVLVMARNYGQTAALEAGFRHASGRVVVPLDADLQNDPADIPDLVRRLEQEQVDAVSGWRRRRQDPFWTKTLPSRIANRVVSWVTRVPLHDYGCTMKAYRSEFLREIRLYGEMHRLIPAYIVWAGGRVVEQEVRHRPRRFGRSKYNLTKTLRLLLDLLTVRFLLGYTAKPLYFIGKYGVWTLFLGVLCFGWVLVKKAVWGEPLYTDPFFPVSIFLLLAGVQILLSGLLAEMAMRTYFESQGKTPWRLRGTFNLPMPAETSDRIRRT